MILIQKLENAHLTILRFAVIIVSGLLLAGAIFLFIAALPAIKPAADVKDEAPKISSDEMVDLLATPETKNICTQ